MKILEKLFGEPEPSSPSPALEQLEREAIVDLLLLAVYVDNHLSLSESKVFDESTDSMGWESETSIYVYLDHATHRVRNVRGNDEAIIELIGYVSERLKSAEARKRAMALLNRLFMADSTTAKEKDFISKVEAAFA